MKKPWSITTTLRNPERFEDFLTVIKEIDGQEWNEDTQLKFQILLIKNRKYGFGEALFYKGLTKEQVDLIDDISKDISFEQAKEIFETKNYKDPDMRGRQSMNPLKKLGLVSIVDNKVVINNLVSLLLNKEIDLGELLFRSFLKWQIPNPDSSEYKESDGYNIKPFIGTLHLINEVNKLYTKKGFEEKGISKQEFSLFVPCLVNFNDIGVYANKIVELREQLSGKSKKEQKEIFSLYKISFAKEFLGTDNSDEVEKLLNNLKDYGDNTLRYFRLTRYFYIRGGGFYIDLEPRRSIEISNLLSHFESKSISFESREEYIKYISDITEPKLPWENKTSLFEIIKLIDVDIKDLRNELGITHKEIGDLNLLSDSQLKELIVSLRNDRRLLQEKKNHSLSQNVDMVKEYINKLENIYDEDDKPLALEKYTALSLHALNDAINIHPNYPVGDDNEPTFTAPAGKPDIECYYESFNSICEVTMLTGRDQWYNEGQPVMRHLREFENKSDNKKTYCLFVAPTLHRDTMNTFWFSVKYEYEGKQQKIIPLTIKHFVQLLKILSEIKEKGGFLKHTDLERLYETVLSKSQEVNNVSEWIDLIPSVINNWQETVSI